MSDAASAEKPIRVLIVEDEMISALYAEELLEELGYQVCGVVASGPKAVSAVGRTHPDLVLMDIRLAQGTDGIAAAEEIRQRFGLPSIFVSAHTDRATMARAEQTGPLGFISKPYSAEQLKSVLGSAAERVRSADDGHGRSA